jgi:O-antigen/teichoic acid export membrane protein
VNTAAKALQYQGLMRRALSLGALKAFDHALQFLLPIILVRCLDAATFGEYRLLWLCVWTVVSLVSLNMGGGLYYFVPRSDAWHKRLYVHQSLVYFLLAGLVCAWLLSAWNPLHPAPVRKLEHYGLLVPAFVALWMFSILMDYLPTVDERIRWQAFATVTSSVLRAVLIGAGAWLTGDLHVVIVLLIAAVLVKLVLLLFYVQRHHGFGGPWFRRAAFAEQFRRCAPLGASSALFSLRTQTDQWVAATLFALSSFAAFTIATIVSQVVQLFRQSVMEAFMPSMSRMEAAGDLRGMMQLNSRANVMVGTALYPLLAFAFGFAEDIVTLVYTAAYVEAAPVMRVYVVGMAAMVIEISSLLLLLRQGAFALRLAMVLICVSAAVSWLGAQALGLAGAAAGSVLAIYLDRVVMLRRVSRLSGIGFTQLQDWGGLGRALAFAAFGAGLAWLVVHFFLPEANPFPRLVLGTVVLAAVYGPLALWGRR